jgi:hypothetical protein
MIILGLNNRIDAATITSDGTFEAALPLANLKTKILAQVARTTTDAAFTITIDLSAKSARSIGALAIAGHNLSRTATVNFKTYQNTTLLDDSGDLSPWPYLHPEDLHWTAHTYSAAIIDTGRIAEANPTLIYFLPANSAANKVEILITDTSNPDAYVEIGRVFVGEQLQPDFGEDYGKASWGLLDFSEISPSQRHILFSNHYPLLRTLQASFDHLTDGEAQGGLQGAQKLAGLTGEMLVAPDRPTYVTISASKAVDSFWFAKAFLSRQTAIDPLQTPYLQANSTTLNLEEIAL